MEKTSNYFTQASISHWVVLGLSISKVPNIYFLLSNMQESLFFFIFWEAIPLAFEIFSIASRTFGPPLSKLCWTSVALHEYCQAWSLLRSNKEKCLWKKAPQELPHRFIHHLLHQDILFSLGRTLTRFFVLQICLRAPWPRLTKKVKFSPTRWG